MVPPQFVITCEHSSQTIPTPFQALFKSENDILNSHRGFDAGALDFATQLSAKLEVHLFSGKYSRLLIDLNRSQKNPSLFSDFTKHLSKEQKADIIKNYYLPYRTDVEKHISDFIQTGRRIIHLSIHSFTPVSKGESRNLDLGLLYDPSRGSEKEFAESIRSSISKECKTLRIRKNQPYRGTNDGFTTYLRKKIGPKMYMGLEIEWNQSLLEKSPGFFEFLDPFYEAIQRIGQGSTRSKT